MTRSLQILCVMFITLHTVLSFTDHIAELIADTLFPLACDSLCPHSVLTDELKKSIKSKYNLLIRGWMDTNREGYCYFVPNQLNQKEDSSVLVKNCICHGNKDNMIWMGVIEDNCKRENHNEDLTYNVIEQCETGDCFYNALSRALYGDEKYCTEVRYLASIYLKAYKNEMITNSFFETELMQKITFNEYLSHIRKEDTKVTRNEMSAVALLYKISIYVYEPKLTNKGKVFSISTKLTIVLEKYKKIIGLVKTEGKFRLLSPNFYIW